VVRGGRRRAGFRRGPASHTGISGRDRQGPRRGGPAERLTVHRSRSRFIRGSIRRRGSDRGSRSPTYTRAVTSRRRIEELLAAVAGGDLSPEQAADRLASLPYTDLGFARVDTHRE